MEKYEVKLSRRAADDADGIYAHISSAYRDPATALKLIALLEKAILSLYEMPYLGAERKNGLFANKGYRQLFVKSYTIVYHIDEEKRTVIIVFVRYTPSAF